MKLKVSHLKKTYNHRVVLDIETLNIQSGSSVAIIGLNGAGKSTLLRILAGLEQEDSGEITYNGSLFRLGEQIAYLPQKPYIFALSVLENVLLGISHLPHSREMALEALERVGMKEFASASATSLSGGEAQKVALARTLVMGKPLLLLDEPASSVDIAGIRGMEEYIREIRRCCNPTLIFASHHLSQVQRLADHAILLLSGQVLEEGSPEDLFQAPQRSETKEFLKYV